MSELVTIKKYTDLSELEDIEKVETELSIDEHIQYVTQLKKEYKKEKTELNKKIDLFMQDEN